MCHNRSSCLNQPFISSNLLFSTPTSSLYSTETFKLSPELLLQSLTKSSHHFDSRHKQSNRDTNQSSYKNTARNIANRWANQAPRTKLSPNKETKRSLSRLAHKAIWHLSLCWDEAFQPDTTEGWIYLRLRRQQSGSREEDDQCSLRCLQVRIS